MMATEPATLPMTHGLNEEAEHSYTITVKTNRQNRFTITVTTPDKSTRVIPCGKRVSGLITAALYIDDVEYIKTGLDGLSRFESEPGQ